MSVKGSLISILIGFSFALASLHADGQSDASCETSPNKKAMKLYNDAASLYKSRKYEEAGNLVSKAIDEDPEFAMAYYLQGNIALKRKEDKVFEQSFLKVVELCPELDPEVYFQLGWYAFDFKKWKETEKYLTKFLSYDRINEEHGAKAEAYLVKAKLYMNPVPFDPVPVQRLSTRDPEYLPYISPDNELAFFTRRYEMKDKNMLTPTSVEKFMIAHQTADGSYDQGVPMEPPFNLSTSNNEGGASITIDNKHLYFTVNEKGNFDICYSDFVDGRWSEIRNMGPLVNDPKQWDSQPSISSDGKVLYFASARDSISGVDIYKTQKDAAGNWTKAIKLGPQINTDANEKSPFLHSDSRTLYFCSDGLPGLGGYDIFMSKMDDKGNWGKPVNIGYPINTESDEVGFFVSTDGKTGYFASNKLNGSMGGYDIYSFNLHPDVRPNKVYFQKGDVNGKANDEPINATIEIRDAVTKKLTKIDVDSISGEFAFVVDFSNDLLLSVKKDGYAFASQYVSSKDTSNDKPVKQDIELKKLEVGAHYTINDIFFSTNSYDINDTIKSVLEEFSDYLKKSPRLQVALHGHTDNVGNPEANMILSENRARTCYNFLVDQGIDKSRLSFKGFGETKPIASNATEEGKAKNRRTVFVVNSK
ncbi:MAG TPA: OmpA family protein [Bacteroidia bacterium]|nr:OmpA family protein [Bacteroidia bacterium]